MVRNGEISLADAKRVLSATGGSAHYHLWMYGIAVAAIKVLPKRYTSQTVVLVDPPAVSAEIVKPVVPANSGSPLSFDAGANS